MGGETQRNIDYEKGWIMSKLDWMIRYEKRNSRPSIDIEYRFLKYLGTDAGILFIHLIKKYYLHELNGTLWNKTSKYFYSIGSCSRDIGMKECRQIKALEVLRKADLIYTHVEYLDKKDLCKKQRFIDLQFEEIEKLYNSL
jgi:hypothetical protein